MGNDELMVLGVFIGALSLAAMISAFSSGEPPRLAIILFVIGGGLVAWVVNTSPTGYSVEEFPRVVMDVIGGFIR